MNGVISHDKGLKKDGHTSSRQLRGVTFMLTRPNNAETAVHGCLIPISFPESSFPLSSGTGNKRLSLVSRSAGQGERRLWERDWSDTCPDDIAHA